MRNRLLLGLGSVLLFTLGGIGPAQADNGPHVSSAAGVGFNVIAGTGGCAGCHRSNTTRTALGPAAGQSGLCLTCHDPSASGSTTDVVDGVSYGAVGTAIGAKNRDGAAAPAALRGGGFESALIGSAAATRNTYVSGSTVPASHQVIPVLAASQPTTSRHGVMGLTNTARDNSDPDPAAGIAVSLECISCHNPHGNGSYRILRTFPSSSRTSAAAAGVRVPDATLKVYTTNNYWLSGDPGVPPLVHGARAGTTVPDGYTATISLWCASCHEGAHIGTTIMMTGTSCATCHVAHGSNATVGPAGSSQVTQPDSPAAHGRSRLLRIDSDHPICLMCHNY